MLFEPRQKPNGVTRSGKSHIADEQDRTRLRHKVREGDQDLTREVDNRHFERIAKLFFQLEKGRAVRHHRLMDRRFSRQKTQLVGRAHHRALDEQPVDTAWVIDRVDQPAPRFEVESQRASAKMDVEVQKGRLATRLFADGPGE